MNLSIDQKATREMSVTAEMIQAYAEVTGDFNPLHFDSGFADRTRFGGLIAQGGITTGLLHALVAMDMPGPGTVFMEQSWRFPAPVYMGDTIRAEATVKWVHDRHPIAKLEFEVRNQDSKVVLEGEATVYQAEPEDGR